MREPSPPASGIRLRLFQLADARALAEAYTRNRDHLAPWEPLRSEDFFGEAWQADDIRQRLARATRAAATASVCSTGLR